MAKWFVVDVDDTVDPEHGVIEWEADKFTDDEIKVINKFLKQPEMQVFFKLSKIEISIVED